MKASTSRLISLTVSLALLLGTIFVFISLLSPAYQDINKLRGELAAHKQVLKNQQEIAEQVKELLGEYLSVAGLEQTIALALPNKEDYPTLFNQIDVLTRNAGLFLESMNLSLLPVASVKTSSGAAVGSLGVIQLNLRLIGNYQSLKNFLATLETNMRVMDVVSLSLTTSGSSGQNFVYNLAVKTYYQTL